MLKQPSYLAQDSLGWISRDALLRGNPPARFIVAYLFSSDVFYVDPETHIPQATFDRTTYEVEDEFFAFYASRAELIHSVTTLANSVLHTSGYHLTVEPPFGSPVSNALICTIGRKQD